MIVILTVLLFFLAAALIGALAALYIVVQEGKELEKYAKRIGL